MRLLCRYFVFTAFMLSGTLGWDTADGADLIGTLKVHVRGLSSSDGNLRFALFDSKKNFLESPVRAEIVEIEAQEGTWIVEELPYGTYAVLVHHDVNANGMMERNWFGKPKEPTGASNDTPAKLGPPKYKNAKFQFDTPALTLTITVK